jgi:hypothetical protein
MSSWLDTVKKTFHEGRAKNANYKFKDALKDAKKYYNKGKNVVVEGSDVVVDVAKKTGKTMKRGVKRMSKRIRKASKKLRRPKHHQQTYKNRN